MIQYLGSDIPQTPWICIKGRDSTNIFQVYFKKKPQRFSLHRHMPYIQQKLLSHLWKRMFVCYILTRVDWLLAEQIVMCSQLPSPQWPPSHLSCCCCCCCSLDWFNPIGVNCHPIICAGMAEVNWKMCLTTTVLFVTIGEIVPMEVMKNSVIMERKTSDLQVASTSLPKNTLNLPTIYI